MKTELLNLPTEAQNNFSYTEIDRAKADNKKYADEADMNIIDYLLADYDACPENWDSIFKYPYDEISARAKEERRNVLERALFL